MNQATTTSRKMVKTMGWGSSLQTRSVVKRGQEPLQFTRLFPRRYNHKTGKWDCRCANCWSANPYLGDYVWSDDPVDMDKQQHRKMVKEQRAYTITRTPAGFRAVVKAETQALIDSIDAATTDAQTQQQLITQLRDTDKTAYYQWLRGNDAGAYRQERQT